MRTKLLHDPRGWIAQPVVQLSTVPTVVEDGVRPRHVDLRPFAVNDGDDVWVLPGGLTRVALPEGQLVVNSSQGGGSKDTWVLGGNTQMTAAETASISEGGIQGLVADQAAVTTSIRVIQQPAHAPEDAPSFGVQQQQQQQVTSEGGDAR